MEYDVDTICFGHMLYDLGDDGVYHSATQAFQKITINDEVRYMNLAGNKVYYGHLTDGHEKSGISETASLASVIGNPSKKYVSKQMIRLYLLKYKVLCSKNSQKYIEFDRNTAKSK